MLNLTNTEAPRKNQMGLFYALLSYIFLVTSHSFVKKLSQHITPLQISNLIGIQLFSSSYLTLVYKNISPYEKNPKTTRMLFVRAVTAYSGSVLLITGVALIPLSEAVVLQMTGAVMTGIMAMCFLNEKYDLTLFFTTLFSFTGVMLITKPAFIFSEHNTHKYDNRMVGMIVTLIGAFTTSISQILVKKLGGTSNPYSTALYLALCNICTAPIIQIFQGINSMHTEDILWALLLGICRYFNHVLLNMSFALEDAGKVSLMAYFQVPFAYVIDVFVFDTEVDRYSVLGSLSVFSCVFVLLYKNYKKEKEKELKSREQDLAKA